MVRVYASTQGLAKTYAENGIASDIYYDFVRGFNIAQPLCDYVDAGPGKDCADVKVSCSSPTLSPSLLLPNSIETH